MRFKPIPEPPDSLDEIERVYRAVPLVPESEADCCARLSERLDVPREEARTWLAFLRALGLVEETARGFVRTRDDLDVTRWEDVEQLADTFRENVYAAREVLAVVVAEGPIGAGETFERVEGLVPQWERHRNPQWRDIWRERVLRLLEWGVLLGLLDRGDDGYRTAPDRPRS